MAPNDNDEPIEALTEVLGDGDIAVGEKTEPEGEQGPSLSEVENFYANLAKLQEPDFLNKLGQQVYEDYDADEESRKPWLEEYTKAVEATRAEQPTDATNDTDQGSGLAQVVHPLIMKAATGYQSHAIAELYPPGGPVSVIIKGESDKEREDQAERVRDYMNYQITEDMVEYFDDLDQLLLHKALVGHIFRKTWYDVTLKRPTIQYVKAEDIVVDYTASNLRTAQRITQILRYNRHTFDELVAEGFYLDGVIDERPAAAEDTMAVTEKVEGREEPTQPDDPRLVLLEQQLYMTLPKDGEVEPEEGEEGESEGVSKLWPYVVTIDKSNKRVVSIRRGWRPKDRFRRRRTSLSSWKLFPGLGFYGNGLYHVIGGLGHAATDVLRAILDGAAFANMKSGFVTKGPNESKKYELRPGELTQIESTTDDINKSIKMVEFAEPGQTLFLLLGALVEQGEKFAAVSGLMTGEGSNTGPVGTTLAMIENGSRVFAGIHIRDHNSQKEDFRNLAELNAEYIPEEGYPYHVEGKDRRIARKDFDERVDIIPVSDPRIFSSTQRISMAQAAWQLATQAPEFHDKFEVLENIYKAMRIPNFKSWLISPVKAVPLDPVSENIALMAGKPVKAFIYQNHQAHIMVLDQWFGSLPPQAQQMIMSQYIAHRAEHMSMLYYVQVQAQLAGAPLPQYPATDDPKKPIPPVDPQTDHMISQVAAMRANQLPPQLGPPLPQPGGAQGGAADPAQAIMLAAKAEAEAIMMKTKAEIEAKKQQHEAELAMKMAEFQQQLQIEKQRAELKAWEVTMKANTEIAAKKIKADAEAEAKAVQTAHEIRRDEAANLHERAESDIDRHRERQMSDIERAEAKQQEAIDKQRERFDQDIDKQRERQQQDIDHRKNIEREDVGERTRAEREDELERSAAKREDEIARKAAKTKEKKPDGKR